MRLYPQYTFRTVFQRTAVKQTFETKIVFGAGWSPGWSCEKNIQDKTHFLNKDNELSHIGKYAIPFNNYHSFEFYVCLGWIINRSYFLKMFSVWFIGRGWYYKGSVLSRSEPFSRKVRKTYLSLSDKYDTSSIYSQDAVSLISANMYKK